MFLIKQGGGWEGEKNGCSGEMCKRCTGTHSLRKSERRAAGIMRRGACAPEWVVGVKLSAVRYAGVTGRGRQPLVERTYTCMFGVSRGNSPPADFFFYWFFLGGGVGFFPLNVSHIYTKTLTP